MTKDKYNAYMRNYYHKNKTDVEYMARKRASARKSAIAKKVEREIYRKRWCQENRTYIATYVRNRRRTNILIRLASNIRCRFRMALKNNSKTGSAIKLLGCSILEFKVYLEAQFQPGMTWENYGQWHLDHKYPLSKFDLTNEKELKIACHYTNIQPLWATDNIKKGNKVWP